MAYTIRLTSSDVRRRAYTIQQNAIHVRNEMQNVEQLLTSLRFIFKGKRSDVFFQRFDKEKAKIENWDEIVRSFADELLNTAARMELADKG